MFSPKCLLPSFISPGWALIVSRLSAWFSKISKWVWLWLLSNYYLFSGSWNVWDFCVHYFWEWSLYFSPSGFHNISPAGLQSKYSGVSNSQWGPSSWGAQHEAQTDCSLRRTCAIVIILPFIDCLLGMWVFSQFSSVTQLCPTLCDPMNLSTRGLPVHHQLPEFTQTHVHRVSDAIQPSHPLSSSSPPAPNPSQHQSLFQWVNSSHEVAKGLEFQL